MIRLVWLIRVGVMRRFRVKVALYYYDWLDRCRRG